MVIDADFGGDDRSAMNRKAKARHFAETGEPHVALVLDGRLDIENTAHAGCPPYRHVIGPGDDGRVADVVVNDAAMSSDGGCVAREDFAQKLLRLQVAMGFGKRSGADEVDEDEDAVFADWTAIAPENEIDEDVTAQQFAHAHDENNDAADDEGEDQCLHLGMHRPFPGAGKYAANPQNGTAKPEATEDEDGVDDEADGNIGRCRQCADLPRQTGQHVTTLEGEDGRAGEQRIGGANERAAAIFQKRVGHAAAGHGNEEHHVIQNGQQFSHVGS